MQNCGMPNPRGIMGCPLLTEELWRYSNLHPLDTQSQRPADCRLDDAIAPLAKLVTLVKLAGFAKLVPQRSE